MRVLFLLLFSFFVSYSKPPLRLPPRPPLLQTNSQTHIYLCIILWYTQIFLYYIFYINYNILWLLFFSFFLNGKERIKTKIYSKICSSAKTASIWPNFDPFRHLDFVHVPTFCAHLISILLDSSSSFKWSSTNTPNQYPVVLLITH